MLSFLKKFCSFIAGINYQAMNYRLTLIFCLALIFSASQSFSQLSKKEKKEWKKKAKEYAKNPANLKQLIEDKDATSSQLTALNQKVTSMQASISDKDAKIAELEDQLS